MPSHATPASTTRPHAPPAIGTPTRDAAAIAAATALALAADGDERLLLGADGRNRYGCAPRPDAALLAFGASTASVVSGPAFDAACALHERLRADPGAAGDERERMRRELLQLSGAAAVPGTALVFAASGTDLHLIAARLAAGGSDQQALMADPAETGSGVPAALAGRHFGGRSCQGLTVPQGAAVAAAALPAPEGVALRHADGMPRAVAEVDAEFTARASAIVAAGRRCLLVLTDLSKTGLLAPSPACATALRARFAGRLDVLVDACQFRLAPPTLAAYLRRGFLVAVTGSKFVGGPAFSGALLLPPAFAHAAGARPLAALAAYTSRGDWSPGWSAAAALPLRPGWGPLLRWEAALCELRRLRALPDAAIEDFLGRWAAAVGDRIATDPAFELLPTPAPQRALDGTGEPWDRLASLVSFRVLRPQAGGGRVALAVEAAAQLWRQMALAAGGGLRVQTGQPVHAGLRQGAPTGALRLSASARWLADAAGDRGRTDAAVALALQALDKLAWLARRP